MTFFVTACAASVVACSSSSSNGTGVDNDGGTQPDASNTTDASPVVDASTALKWEWMDISGAKCRDGSATGIGVNINPGSTKTMIFLEGGGACFNKQTCSGNPSKYAESDFKAAVAAAGAAGFNGSFDSGKTNGIMSRNDPKNAVKDWNMIYVPYCTGDIHGGTTTGTVPEVTGTQQFAGRNNIALDLVQVKALLPGTTEVLLTGMSGGGFGTVMAYDQVATFWGSVPVNMIDDSGPPMADPYLPSCLQTGISTLWGLDQGVIADCGADCQEDGSADTTGHFGINVMKHIAKKYPNRNFGLIEATADFTISSFFGFGAENCTTFLAPTPPQFTAGLLDIRAQMAAYPNFGTFYFTSQDHTSYEGQLDTRVAGGDLDGGGPAVNLSDWTTSMVNGTVTNAGP